MSQETAQTCHTDKTSCVHVKCEVRLLRAFLKEEGGEGVRAKRRKPLVAHVCTHSFPGAMSRDALDKAWRLLLVVGSGLGDASHGGVLWYLIVSVIRVLQRRTRQHHDVILSSISSKRDPFSSKSRQDKTTLRNYDPTLSVVWPCGRE